MPGNVAGYSATGPEDSNVLYTSDNIMDEPQVYKFLYNLFSYQLEGR